MVLDSLLDRSDRELAELYRKAAPPRVAEVAGDLRGRMLAWPMLASRPRVARLVRACAASERFPWRGKTFAPPRPTATTRADRRGAEPSGGGDNRVLSERLHLFRFETFVARSRAGDFDAVQLDYDLPGNPPIIRSIKDEIRELEPGLWLGQAYLRAFGREHLWLYFALARAPLAPTLAFAHAAG